MKIVFFMTPAYGHVLPVLPIIRELINKGNEVTCYNTPAFRERIENLGAHYREYGEEFQKLKPYMNTTSKKIRIAAYFKYGTFFASVVSFGTFVFTTSVSRPGEAISLR